MARASILWLMGEYCEHVPKIAPDVLRKMAKSFTNEEDIVKLQTVNLAAKLYLTNSKQVKSNHTLSGWGCVSAVFYITFFLLYRLNCWLSTFWTWASMIRTMTSETERASFVSWLSQTRRAELWANMLAASWWRPNRLLSCSLPSKVTTLKSHKESFTFCLLSIYTFFF